MTRRSCPTLSPAQLSLSDPHFPDCPLASSPGYRDLALSALPRLSALDLSPVAPRDRAAAEDAALRQTLGFVAALERLRARHEADLAALEQGRAAQARNVAAAAARASDRLAQLEVRLRGGPQISIY